MIQRYADLSLEELRGEHYLRCLQPSDKSATVDAPPTGSSTDAGGVDYVRSASLQTPYLGNAMTPSLAATKPNPRNDSNALGGAMEATGYLDVAVVAVKNVPALPSLPHAFEVACTIGVDGMVSNTDKQKHRGTHVRALSPSPSPSLTPSPPLSLPRALLSLCSLSSLSLFSLFSLSFLSLSVSFSLSHTNTQVSTTADVPWAPEMSFDQEFRFMVASTASTVTLSVLARAFTGADGELLGTCSVDVDGLLRGGGTQVCGIQMCFAQALGCECEYARVALADMDILACGSFRLLWWGGTISMALKALQLT